MPVVEVFWRWADGIAGALARPPKDPLLKAVAWARNRGREPEVYLMDPEVAIDTNHHDKSGPSCRSGTAQLAVLLERDRDRTHRHRSQPSVDPTTWLIDVLQRVASHPAREIALLTPRCGRITSPPVR